MLDALAVAGLVVGLLPVVTQAIGAYKDTVIGKEVQRLSRSLGVIEANYRNSLEKLLIDSGVDHDAYKWLNEPGSSAWWSAPLQEKLRVHLDTHYEVFRNAIEDIKEMIEELHEAFKPKHRPSRRKLLKYIKSFTSRPINENGLQLLGYKVEELDRLTKESSNLAAYRFERAKIAVYKQVRDSAAHLHGALSEGWTCQCEDQHYANLLLETRQTSSRPGISPGSITNDDHVTRFRFLFSFKSLSKDETLDTNGQETWRELEIQPLPEDESIDKLPKIEDLCAFVRDLKRPVRSTRDCLGYLYKSDSPRRHGLFTVPESEAQSQSVVSLPLAQILSPPNSRSSSKSGRPRTSLSLATRVRLAVVLSSAMLQLHSTPWLDPIWSKEEICCFEPSQSREAKRLYLQHKFESKLTPVSSRSTFSSDYTLTRVTSNMDNVPWAINRTIYNLGVILLELSLGQNIEQLTTEFVGPAERNEVTELRTISLVLRSRRVAIEADPLYHDAVYSCIHCNFDLPEEKMVLHNPEFQKNVLKKIVQPLEELSKNFPYI